MVAAIAAPARGEAISLTGKPLGSEEEQALSARLLATVQRIGPELKASTPESERQQSLSPTARELLKSNSLLNMRLMKEMGGLEASIATQCKVLAAIAEWDAASAWCAMVHNNGVGTLAAYFPDASVNRIFADGPPVVSFVAAPSGVATPCEGGYRVTGAWRFCSGFANADWIVCGARSQDGSEELLLVVPKADVDPADNWNVLGLRGTGSVDFSLKDYFVSRDYAIENTTRVQRRGSRFYGRPGILIAVYEHAAFAWGTGRRALRLLAQHAERIGPEHQSWYTVTSELGRLTVELEAASTLMLDYYTVLETLTAEQTAEPSVCAQGRAIATYITEVAARCADAAFKRSGTKAGFLPNDIEQTLRDMRMAQAHILVNDGNYALYGSFQARQAG